MNLRRKLQPSCLSDGEIKVVIDGEVNEMQRIQDHISVCEHCRERMDELAAQALFTHQKMDLLRSSEQDVDVDSARLKLRRRLAATSMQRESEQVQGESFMSSMWRHRALRGTVAMLAIMVLTAAFVFTPMRSLANDFFNRMEVEKFEAITVQPEEFTEFGLDLALRAFTADHERLMLVSETLYEIDTSYDKTALENNAVVLDSVDAARDAFGEFKLPSSLPSGFESAPQLMMSNQGSATVTLDTASVHVIIDELRLPIESIPPASEMPSMVFQSDIPAALVAYYDAGVDGHLAVIQMESPVITTPEGLDMNALRDEVLSMPGLPEDFVAQLRNIDNWQNTLVLPVPEGAETRDVTIDGNGGLLIEAGTFDGAEFGFAFELDGDLSVVMWNDEGSLYIVAGTLDGDQLLDVATSLR